MSCVSRIVRQILYHCDTWEALKSSYKTQDNFQKLKPLKNVYLIGVHPFNILIFIDFIVHIVILVEYLYKHIKIC